MQHNYSKSPSNQISTQALKEFIQKRTENALSGDLYTEKCHNRVFTLAPSSSRHKNPKKPVGKYKRRKTLYQSLPSKSCSCEHNWPLAMHKLYKQWELKNPISHALMPGMQLKVIKAKQPSLINLTGILVAETGNMLILARCEQEQAQSNHSYNKISLLKLPKKSTVLQLQSSAKHEITMHTSHDQLISNNSLIRNSSTSSVVKASQYWRAAAAMYRL